MSMLDSIEAAIDRPVLVFGSLPPHGRDVDLLARPPEAAAVQRVLREERFVQRRSTWARFAACSAEVVDLIPAERWRLPPEEVEALFGRAIPLPGHRHVARPSPPDALLILARRVASGGGLDRKKRDRIDSLLRESPGAWDEARARAAAWAAERALEVLRRAYSGDESAAHASVRRRRGAVIALSGLDGAGKTWQANALRDSLHRLGYEAVVEWTRLTHNPSLAAIASPAKRLLSPVAGGSREAPADDRARALRRKSGFLTQAWATVVAVANASSQRRATVRHVRAGRIVICDRYTLDSAAHLRRRYGERRRFPFQVFLIRLLSPRPVRSYLLEVRPETALTRKQDKYGLDQLRQQARLYRTEARRLGATVLDAERPAEDLCREIALDVWMRLR